MALTYLVHTGSAGFVRKFIIHLASRTSWEVFVSVGEKSNGSSFKNVAVCACINEIRYV